MTDQKAKGGQRPRIHWYPSGDFAKLPLHASGIYEGNNRSSASDYIVSSYTTSLSTLIKAREEFQPVRRQEIQILLFGEPNAPGLRPIPSVQEEIQRVATIAISASVQIRNTLGVAPVVKSVLQQIPAAHVLHLACHGQQHTEALKSAFALQDGPLTISDLMALDLPKAMLAYLGACETAKGDTIQPDQAVHLAASMLFCGFRSVVATMW
jgi:CHAT domain-containing protein